MKFEFQQPLEYRGRVWTEVQLRRPTPKELRQHWRPNTVVGAINLLHMMTQIPKAALREMDGCDADQICAALAGLISGENIDGEQV